MISNWTGTLSFTQPQLYTPRGQIRCLWHADWVTEAEYSSFASFTADSNSEKNTTHYHRHRSCSQTHPLRHPTRTSSLPCLSKRQQTTRPRPHRRWRYGLEVFPAGEPRGSGRRWSRDGRRPRGCKRGVERPPLFGAGRRSPGDECSSTCFNDVGRLSDDGEDKLTALNGRLYICC